MKFLLARVCSGTSPGTKPLTNTAEGARRILVSSPFPRRGYDNGHRRPVSHDPAGGACMLAGDRPKSLRQLPMSYSSPKGDKSNWVATLTLIDPKRSMPLCLLSRGMSEIGLLRSLSSPLTRLLYHVQYSTIFGEFLFFWRHHFNVTLSQYSNTRNADLSKRPFPRIYFISRMLQPCCNSEVSFAREGPKDEKLKT